MIAGLRDICRKFTEGEIDESGFRRELFLFAEESEKHIVDDQTRGLVRIIDSTRHMIDSDDVDDVHKAAKAVQTILEQY